VLNPVDGSEDILICDVDGASDVGSDGCNVTGTASPLSTSAALFAVVMAAALACVGRKRRPPK
jgi:hypothetical protein